MKKIAVILIIVGASATRLFAQGDVISSLFEKYYDDESFTKVSVSSKMFSLFTKIEPGDEDEKEILDAISKLKGLKVLAADSVANPKKMYDDVVKKVSTSGYDELMEVKDAEENMKFMIHEKGAIIDELVMIVGGKKHFVVISLYGEIDLKNISKLSKSMNVKGMEYLQNMDDNKSNHHAGSNKK